MRHALLVIDVQRALFEPLPRPYEADEVVDRINALTARAREVGTPVVFIQHESPRGSLAFDSEGWQLASRLVVADGDVRVRKTTPDSFLRTNLAELLQGLGTEHLMICGYASEYCVDSTTRSALAHGFPVTLVADAHTTHDATHASGAAIRVHENATLPSLESFGPRIEAKATGDIVFEGA